MKIEEFLSKFKENLFFTTNRFSNLNDDQLNSNVLPEEIFNGKKLTWILNP